MSRKSPMASLRAWLLGSMGGRSSRNVLNRRRSAFRPELGVLEERVVQTVVFTPVFGSQALQPSSNPNGQYTVLNHPTVELIFWGAPDPVNTPKTPTVNYWSTTQGQAAANKFISDAKSILGGPYLSGLIDYGSDGKADWGGSWIDPTNTPPAGYDPGSSSAVSVIQQEIKTAITTPGSGIPAPSTANSTIYVVVTSPSSSKTNGGYNSAGTYNNTPINMISLGSSINYEDGLTLTFSHEMAENMSDPTGDAKGVTVFPPAGLPVSLGSGSSQIGDNEPEPAGQAHYGYRLNNVLVQPYWSWADDAFIVPDAPWNTTQPKIYQAPVWSNPTSATPTFSGNYLSFSTEVKDAGGHIFGLVSATGVVDELVNGSWVQVGSGITSLVGDMAGNVYCLNPTGPGYVYEHVAGTGWNWNVVGSGITSLAADRFGDVFSLNAGSGLVYKHVLNTGWNWSVVGSGITSMVSDSTGNVYTLNPSGPGYVYEHVQGTGWNWNIVGSGITSMVGDSLGNVYTLNGGSGLVYEHNLNTGWSWNIVGSGITQLVSDVVGNVYSLNPTGSGYVYEHNLNTGWSWNIVGSGITQMVSDVVGNVYSLNPTGSGYVYEHNLNTGWSWNIVGSGISSLVSDVLGNVYSLNPVSGIVYEHNLNTGWSWTTIGNGFSSLTSDATGNVFAVSTSGIRYKHVLGAGWSWVRA